MGAHGSISSVVMDDPLTPLYGEVSCYLLLAESQSPVVPAAPAGNSFDQELHQQDFILSPPTEELYSKPLSNTANGHVTGTQAPYEPGVDFELPVDVLELLEGFPLDLGQFSESSNLLPPDCYQPIGEPALQNIIETIPSKQIEQKSVNERQDEEIIMDFEELVSYVDLASEAEDQVPSGSLQLDIGLAKSSPPEQATVTTPDLIKLLLEGEAPAERVRRSIHKPRMTLNSIAYQEPIIPNVVHEMKAEPEDPPQPRPPRQRPAKSNKIQVTDLRRERNNIASRKSRENRRKKFLTQKQLVDELEAGNRRLESRAKQLESLIDQLTTYVTGR